MKKIKVLTQQKVRQDWEYIVEVPDDFVLKMVPTASQSAYIMDKIYNEGIEGHCKDNDNIISEDVIDYEEQA